MKANFVSVAVDYCTLYIIISLFNNSLNRFESAKCIANNVITAKEKKNILSMSNFVINAP